MTHSLNITSSSPTSPTVPLVLAGALVGLFAYQQWNVTKDEKQNVGCKEDFVNYPRTIVVDTITRKNGQEYSTCNNNQAQLNARGNVDVIQVPATYQSAPPPRMSNVSIGAAINWNPPVSTNMALDSQNPLPWAHTIEQPTHKPKMIKERFDSSVAPTRTNESYQYQNTGAEKSSAMYQDMQENLAKQGSVLTEDTLSVNLPKPATMQVTSVETDTREPTITYDRLMIANIGRLRGHSDMIRGDLPIVPIKSCTDPNSAVWMRPPGDPSTLNSGALAVLGGAYGSDMRQTAQLKMINSGGTRTAQAGTTWVPPAESAVGQKLYNMSQTDSTLVNGGPFGDVSYSRLLDDISQFQGQTSSF